MKGQKGGGREGIEGQERKKCNDNNNNNNNNHDRKERKMKKIDTQDVLQVHLGNMLLDMCGTGITTGHHDPELLVVSAISTSSNGPFSSAIQHNFNLFS